MVDSDRVTLFDFIRYGLQSRADPPLRGRLVLASECGISAGSFQSLQCMAPKARSMAKFSLPRLGEVGCPIPATR